MKVILLSKKSWRFFFLSVLILSLAGGTLAFLNHNATPAASQPQRRLPIYSVGTEEKKLALTFDCAWENSDTEVLLSILEQNGAKATFFTTGDWCSRYPDDVKALAAAGHDIGNHSYAHPHVASISREKLIEDTNKCDDIIETLTGARPFLYRAPYGEYDDEMITVIEDELSHKVIQWDVDSRDWQKREAADMVESVRSGVRPGSILLFHNDTKNTPAALRQLLPLLKGEGYEFVLVKDLIYTDNYTLDHEGRQQPAANPAP